MKYIINDQIVLSNPLEGPLAEQIPLFAEWVSEQGEYPKDINIAGSYLYEPAGSIHTLHVPDSNNEETEVCFVMNGANLNLNSQDEVESVLDAGAMLEVYNSMCEAQGETAPKVLGV